MEISNKTLAALLVVSLVISALGILFGVQAGITGAATASEDTGKVNLTITTQTKLVFVNDTVFFGEGSVNESYDSCTMDTEGGIRAAECDGFSNVTSGLSFRNDGNTNLSVQINFTKDAAAYIGGSNPSPVFEWKITAEYNRTSPVGQLDDTVESCKGNGYAALGGWQNTTYGNVIKDQTAYICGNGSLYPLEPTNTRDDAVIDFNLTLPANAPVGGKTMTVTIIGTSTE